MRGTISRCRALVLVLAFAPVAGCGGGSGPTSGQAAPTSQQGMTELKLLLEQYQQDKKKPPAKLDDLSYLEPSYPGAVRGLMMDVYVYTWGAGIKPGGTAVIAYDKAAATAGGTVMLEDGTIKTLTAAEFAAAPKAGKK